MFILQAMWHLVVWLVQKYHTSRSPQKTHSLDSYLKHGHGRVPAIPIYGVELGGVVEFMVELWVSFASVHHFLEGRYKKKSNKTKNKQNKREGDRRWWWWKDRLGGGVCSWHDLPTIKRLLRIFLVFKTQRVEMAMESGAQQDFFGQQHSLQGNTFSSTSRFN